jgi:hypothetical protein
MLQVACSFYTQKSDLFGIRVKKDVKMISVNLDIPKVRAKMERFSVLIGPNIMRGRWIFL